MNLGPYAAYIVSAYATAVIILGGLILWVALDYSVQIRKLARLEERGMSRRSDAAKPAPPPA